MRVYPCPLCGRQQNRNGVPFDDPTQTTAHITGAHDAAHSVTVGDDLREEIESAGVEVDGSDMQTHNPAPFVGNPDSDDIERLEERLDAQQTVIDMQARAIGELTANIERLLFTVDRGRYKEVNEAVSAGEASAEFDLLDGYKEAYEQGGTL
jgi:hypothetical protein